MTTMNQKILRMIEIIELNKKIQIQGISKNNIIDHQEMAILLLISIPLMQRPFVQISLRNNKMVLFRWS